MIKTKIETRTLTEKVVEDIICNKCGLSCRDSSDMNYEGLIEARVCGGYGSFLGDSTEYRFSLCEKCLQVLFDTFKHEPFEDGEDDE